MSLYDRFDAIKTHEKMANNNRIEGAADKKNADEIEQEFDEKIQRKEAKRQEAAENRKEALKDLGEDLVDLAKVTGKGVKETFRIAYNLALGKNVKF